MWAMENDVAFNNWLAGFVDGEGHFCLAKSKNSIYARFCIEVRQDDRPILEEIQRRLGIGRLKDRTRTRGSGPGISTILTVDRVEHCGVLCDIFDTAPLRAKKAVDYRLWSKAVRHIIATPRGVGRDTAMLEQTFEQIKEVRVFRYKKAGPAPT